MGVTGKWVIELRSGTFFQGLDESKGGRIATAWLFATKEIAESTMRKHVWILAAGGMAVPR